MYLTSNEEYTRLRREAIANITDSDTDTDIKKITAVSKLIQTENKYVKSLIGIEICKYLESKYKSSSNEGKKKFIIPVGIAASGKSILVNNYKNDQTVILDADDMREIIFNFVYKDILGSQINFKVKVSDRTELDNYIKANYLNLLIKPLQNFVNFGKLGDPYIQENSRNNIICTRGIEPYCDSKIQLYNNFFYPCAMEIFLIFCKDKNLNFLYDAANCKPQFRSNLMIRAKRMADFDSFKVPVLIPILQNIQSNIDKRNNSILRQTQISLSIRFFKELFDINEDLLNALSVDNKAAIIEIKSKLNGEVLNFEEFYQYDLVKLLTELFNSMYKQNGYGVPDYTKKYESKDYIVGEIITEIVRYDQTTRGGKKNRQKRRRPTKKRKHTKKRRAGKSS